MQRPETGIAKKGVWINVGVQTARLPFGKNNFVMVKKMIIFGKN